MNYWITTDTHFNHSMLVELGVRPVGFSEMILKKLKNTLQPKDVLIHLGDICFGISDTQLIWNERLINISPCQKWLIRGNHDQKSDSWYLDRGWNFIANRFGMNKYGKDILFSHVPVKDNGYDINIHGHFHDANHRKHEPELLAIANDKQVLIALELTNYMPVNLKQLVKQQR